MASFVSFCCYFSSQHFRSSSKVERWICQASCGKPCYRKRGTNTKTVWTLWCPRFSPFISQTSLECVWILKTHKTTNTHTSSHTLSHPHNKLTYVTEQGQIFFFKKPTNHVVFETTAYGLHSSSGGRNKYELVDWCSIFPFSAACCWVHNRWSVWKQWSKISPWSYMWC